MLKVIIILLFFSFYLPSNSSPKDKIISQMKLTNNLSFNFLQTINDKSENGKCIIKYPKKKVKYIGRRPSASTATGNLNKHLTKQKEILEKGVGKIN